jgi:hypothetical protein
MPVKKKKNKKEDFQKLHDAYIIFLQELKEFEKKETELGSQIRNAVDQDGIHNVLKKIVNIKN